MGFKGVIRVEVPQNTLRNMKVGQEGYILCHQFIIGRIGLCLPFNTRVFDTLDEMEDKDLELYAKITRIGDGVSSDSYDIDATVDNDFDHESWPLYPAATLDCYQKSADWLFFPDIKISYEVVSNEELMEVALSDMSLEDLEELKAEAMNQEDYMRVNEIQNEINERE